LKIRMIYWVIYLELKTRALQLQYTCARRSARTCVLVPSRRAAPLAMTRPATTGDRGQFFNFNRFLILFKNNSGKHYLHPVTPLAAPGGVARHAPPHAAVPRWTSAARGAGVGPRLPRHPAWRGSAGSTGPAWPLSSSSSLSSSAQARLHQAPPPAGTPPNPAICGGDDAGRGESGADNFRLRSESEFSGYGEEFLLPMQIWIIRIRLCVDVE
jgi:hypothetical protein